MKVKSFTVDAEVADSAAATRLELGNASAPLLEQPAPRTADWRDGKRTLHLTEKRGAALHMCASMNPREYLCCSVRVLEAVSNCPFDCTYCFLQSYLNDTTMRVVADVDALVAEVRARVSAEPWRFWRIGTWELGDSLALDPMTGTTAELVRQFASVDNAVLELRTKSDRVAGLLDVDHRGHTVVGWTVNPAEVVRREELGTASVERRVAAMAEVIAAGYPISLHFDPLIIHDGWEQGYTDLVEQIFAVVPSERIAWISLGALRFNPEMKKLIAANYPNSAITRPEMVLGNDGKVRYVKPLRLPLYHHLVDLLAAHGARDCALYLCMERWDVWERVLGWHPDSSAHLEYEITSSLHRRFPRLVINPPERSDYEAAAGE